MCLSGFEEQYSNLSEVEVDKVLGFMSHIRSEIPTNDTMPCRVILLVKLLLDVGSDILLYVKLLYGLKRAIITKKHPYRVNSSTIVKPVHADNGAA